MTEKTLFICKGAAFRPQYLLDAVKKGAVAYISETKMEVPVPGLIVKDIRKAMARHRRGSGIIKWSSDSDRNYRHKREDDDRMVFKGHAG